MFILPHHAVKEDVSVLSDVVSVSILLGRWIHGGVRRHIVRYSRCSSLGFRVDVGSLRYSLCLLFRQVAPRVFPSVATSVRLVEKGPYGSVKQHARRRL